MGLEAGINLEFVTGHFLAPAIRVDTFIDKLGPLMGPDRGLRHLNIYTMSRDAEMGDTCPSAGDGITVYGKSLLYLIHYALEKERQAPILGLEVSLRSDRRLSELFGLDGSAASPGEVIWSPTQSSSGRRATQSRTHGGFDDDAATMNSVLRWVLDKDDEDNIKPFPPESGQRGFEPWRDQLDWPEELDRHTSAPATVGGTSSDIARRGANSIRRGARRSHSA